MTRWRLVCRRTSVLSGFPGLRRGLARSRRPRTAAQPFKFGFQFAYAFLQFGQAIERRNGLEPLAIVDSGITGKHRTRRNIVGNATLGGNDGAVADGEMAGG